LFLTYIKHALAELYLEHSTQNMLA